MAPSIAELPMREIATPKQFRAPDSKKEEVSPSVMPSVTPSITHLEIPYDEEQKLERHLAIPGPALERLRKAGIDLSRGYPDYPRKLTWLQDVLALEPKDRDYIDPGSRADPEKKALFGAAKQVKHLTKHIATEIVGLQLKDLTPEQKDELGLLIAERSVVFFRDQDLSPQQQEDLGRWYGDVDIHPLLPHVPGVKGAQIIWPDLQRTWKVANFRQPGGNSRWHTDEGHGKYPAGITHVHHDTVPEIGGDTLWASGYSAYEKLSPAFRRMIDGKYAVYKSAHQFLSKSDPTAGLVPIEGTHLIVRVHPATGWKSLYVNRSWTSHIVGLDKAESDLILGYLFDVYEKNSDIQVRFQWTPRTSALWDNRITIHQVSWDYEGEEPRHGTRVISLAEKPYFQEDAPTRREALGLELTIYNASVSLRG